VQTTALGEKVQRTVDMAVLTDKQRAELKLIFQKFDKDGDGQLTANELKAAFQKMEVPMSDLDIADMIGQADSDGSGTIDFNEYCSYKVALDETKIKEYFDVNILALHLLYVL
jgi:Ca2+-binding EF-hand superfamily protein